MENKKNKTRIRKNTPGRIIYSTKEIEEMERKEKERIFWDRIVRGDGLGGKKGHDN